MSTLLRSSRRPADVLHAASKDVCISQHPDFVESSDEQRSSPLRVGAARDSGRPNNWQDCYSWPDNSTDRTIKKTVRLECYDKWARHLDPKNLKEKSKANNITDLSLMPPLLDLHSKLPAFIKQHLPEKKTIISNPAARTIDDFGNHCDPAELLQAVQPVSKSVKEDAAQSSSCIWTTLSDFLPQSKASLDQMNSCEIVAQVMNIRDKLLAASSFRVTLGKQPDSEMKRLQQDYLDAIFEILQRQESCYVIALKRAIAAGKDIHSPPNAAEIGSPKSDSKSEERTELDVSESSSDELENPTEFASRGPEIPLNNQRPMIEDHLGHYSDSDLEELQQKLKRLNERTLTDCMVLPRESAYASSNLSPRSPLLNDSSVCDQNFQYDNVLSVGQDASGLMPVNAFTENRTPRPALKSQSYGRTKRRPSTDVKNKRGCRHTCEYQRCHFDNADNFMLDCSVEDQEDKIIQNDANEDIIEDLSQLMKKRQELESYLAERSDQLKELQEQHDLLKELVEQKEKEQEQADAVLQKMNDVCPTFGGKIGQLLTKSDHLPSKKMDDSCVRESKGNIHEGATAQSQMTSNYGSSSRQKSLHNSSFRIKEKDKDAVINDKENIRSSIKHDCNRRVRNFRGSSNPWVEAPSGNSMPGSPELFADCTKSKDAGELNCDDEDDDNAGRLPSDTECKYLQKKSKQFETDEESASGTEADDGPNSSLALRDELQHSQNKSKEDYLSECDYADDSVSNPEQLTKSLQNEDTLVKLQFNMSKLVEARKEIEDLRNLLHDQAHQAPTPKAIKTSRASGPGENKSSRKPMQEVKPPGTAVTFDTQETDHKLLQKLRLLKIANEKLDRLKLVMDEVQRYSNFSPPSNSAISPSTFEDRISTAKASNTSRASNLTSRLTQISELTAMTTAVATERMQSEQSMDVTEKSSLHVNSKSLASSGKNNCQPAVKNTVFIRNSLPESVSSLVTSHPRSGSHGGAAGLTSGAMKEKVKIPSKNSSATNISKVSCLPCVSKSADRLPNDVCQQNSASTSQRVEKNSKKPFKATKNQYLESSSAADQSLSSMFQRRRCGNDVDAVPFSQKDSNAKKKRLAINTGKMQQNEVHEKRQMKAELKNIRLELKLLRQEVGSLTQSVDFYILSSGQKLEGHRGDVLDPKLLVGLNQSFQRLLVDNQQLSERFSQLRDFVVKHSCEKSADNAFHIHRQDKGFGFACDKHMKYQVANEAVCSSDETWVKEAINPLIIKDIHHGKSEDRHPARILAYMENDVTSQGGRPQRMNMNTSASDNVKDCYGINRNRNNSKAISVGINPAMTFHNAGERKSLKEINRSDMDMKSPAPNTISENDSSIEHNRFDSLSEKIYSEVAMLISKHENRPHYLLELIMLLQKLKTSTLRQQTVDAFNEIISDYLTDDQLSVPMPFNVEAEKMPRLLSDDMLQYKYSAYYGGDAFEPEMESCATGGNRENDLLNEENEIENQAGCGRVDFCTGYTEYGTSGCLDNLQAPVDSNENDDNSMEESGDGRFIGPEKLEDNWPVIEGDLDVGSEDDDVLYPPDFKSTSSSNLEEEVKNMNAGESEISAMECQDLNTVAEQMGFITVEFANSSSLTLKANSENEKGSFGSNESWEETEISERDADHRNGSDSSEIIEEIIVEDDSSESVEETRIDQPYAILTSMSKDEIARQMAAEYQGELSTQLILETVQPNTLNELAGDASGAKQPVSSTCDESKSRNF